MPIRILIADDHPLVREGLRYVLANEPSLDIVGEVANGQEAVNFLRSHDVDVVLLDINMPVLNGVEACQTIKQEKPWVDVIALTIHDQDDYVFGMIKNGASGYLLKDTPPDVLIQTIHATARGEMCLSPHLVTRVLQEFSRLARNAGTPADALGLTERETEVLGLLVSGCTNLEIARRLSISQQTVRNHLTRLFAKLGVPNRTQAALYAVKNKLF